jgi:hypothetical protein
MIATASEKEKAQAAARRAARLNRLALTIDADLSMLPDHERAAVLLRREVRELGIEGKPVFVAVLVEEQEGGRAWEHRKFEVVIRRGDRREVFGWRQGMGVAGLPSPAEVLAWVAEEGRSAVCERFEDWAPELGYDVNSRRAEAAYHACVESWEKLRRLGLTAEQVARLADFAREL